MGYEDEVNEQGERHTWLAPNVVDRLRALRGPGESYSDLILEDRGCGFEHDDVMGFRAAQMELTPTKL